MNDALSAMLAERDWILADGATGTNLFNAGLSSGDAPEFWNVDEPAKITALYKGSVDAGSDLFLTNTFGGNAARLKLHDGQNRVGRRPLQDACRATSAGGPQQVGARRPRQRAPGA